MIPGRRFARAGVTSRISARRSLPGISSTGATPLANTIKVLNLLRVFAAALVMPPGIQTSPLGVSCPNCLFSAAKSTKRVDSRSCLTLDALRLFNRSTGPRLQLSALPRRTYSFSLRHRQCSIPHTYSLILMFMTGHAIWGFRREFFFRRREGWKVPPRYPFLPSLRNSYRW